MINATLTTRWALSSWVPPLSWDRQRRECSTCCSQFAWCPHGWRATCPNPMWTCPPAGPALCSSSAPAMWVDGRRWSGTSWASAHRHCSQLAGVLLLSPLLLLLAAAAHARSASKWPTKPVPETKSNCNPTAWLAIHLHSTCDPLVTRARRCSTARECDSTKALLMASSILICTYPVAPMERWAWTQSRAMYWSPAAALTLLCASHNVIQRFRV